MPPTGCCPVSGKLLRPKLKEHYGAALEQMYADLDGARADELRALLDAAASQPVVDSVVQAAQALLGISGSGPEPTDKFLDLGGDSLSALTFSNLLQDVFGVEMPVGVIIGPTTTLADIAAYVERERSGDRRVQPSAASTASAPRWSAPRI